MKVQSKEKGQSIAQVGLSLFELAIGTTLFTIGLLAAFGTVGRTSHAYESSSARVIAEARLILALEQVQNALEPAQLGTLVPDPTGELGTSDLLFKHVIFGSTDEVQYRLHTRLETGELPNGFDDDGDRLVDELELILVRDPAGTAREQVLMRGICALGTGELADLIDNDGDGLVDEPGFVIRRENDSLRIHLSAQGAVRGEDQPFDLQLEGRVRLRN